MSLIKIASMIMKSPLSWNNCYTGLKNSGKTFLGFNKEQGFVHFFKKNGKNSIEHFTCGPFGKINKPHKLGDDFLGAVHIFTNKDAKRKLKQFDEIYKFKSLESAKRFRDQLKEFL